MTDAASLHAAYGAWLVGLVATMALGSRVLIRLLASKGPRVTNYRGASVPVGLGLIWLVWPAALGVADLLSGVALRSLDGGMVIAGGQAVARAHGAVVQITALVVPVMVVGLIDDLFGTTEVRGLRGHLRSALDGRPTTGGFKLLAVGGLGAIAAYGAMRAGASGGVPPTLSDPSSLALWAAATVVVAGMANLVNLFDLRPGRALKVYAAVTIAGCVALALGPLWADHLETADAARAAGVVLVLLLVPGLVIARADLGERGMLGDGGSNAFGFVAGMLLVYVLPVWAVAIAAVAVAGANLASERVSYSRVIERTAALRRIDAWGRPRGPRVASDEAPDIPDER